jgi:hypothetical protein
VSIFKLESHGSFLVRIVWLGVVHILKCCDYPREMYEDAHWKVLCGENQWCNLGDVRLDSIAYTVGLWWGWRSSACLKIPAGFLLPSSLPSVHDLLPIFHLMFDTSTVFPPEPNETVEGLDRMYLSIAKSSLCGSSSTSNISRRPISLIDGDVVIPMT